jgi:hypothetical protein
MTAKRHRRYEGADEPTIRQDVLRGSSRDLVL